MRCHCDSVDLPLCHESSSLRTSLQPLEDRRATNQARRKLETVLVATDIFPHKSKRHTSYERSIAIVIRRPRLAAKTRASSIVRAQRAYGTALRIETFIESRAVNRD